MSETRDPVIRALRRAWRGMRVRLSQRLYVMRVAYRRPSEDAPVRVEILARVAGSEPLHLGDGEITRAEAISADTAAWLRAIAVQIDGGDFTLANDAEGGDL